MVYPFRIALALIGLCGLMCGQNWQNASGNSTSTLSVANISSAGSSGGIVMFVTGAGQETENRSAKAPSVTLKEVKSTSRKIQQNELPTPGYMKLARSISLKSPAIEEAELAQIIVDHGFSIYDYGKVDNYLYHQALAQGTNVRWVWKGMRDKDAKASDSFRYQTFDGMGRVIEGTYGKAIPERVLAKAECLLNELPDAILLVSDYEVRHPDPFLAVTTARMLQEHRIFIVDQWDEPGFTEKPIVKPYDEDKVLQKFPGFVMGGPGSRNKTQSLSGN